MIAVRVLRDGSVVRESVFSTLPVTIGRSPESDLVLFDDSVSRAHARIEGGEDGTPRIVDLGSRNGVHVGPVRVASAPVDGLLKCRVGVVELEIEPFREAITREIKLRDWNRFERRRTALDQLRYLAIGVLGWLAGTVLDPGFWSPWNKTRGVTVLGSALGVLVALPLLSAALLVLLKAFGRQLRVGDALHTLSGLVWIWPASSALSLFAYYPVSAGALATFKGALAIAGAVLAVVVMASVRRRPPSFRFRAAWALAALAIAAGIAWTTGLSARKSGEPPLDFHVQVPLAGFSGRAESLDAYMGSVREISRRAAEAAEAVRARQDPD